ncbi:AraC family transcriptional regulator [Novisyntrophococcus fermenticellae]|uniref:AraC family transcriptional regulator n=1 Tax=Novisyntrophococcus fermenticellae TaxID=2068655 RepID=UPI001E2926FE|nr:AraC family transcriptional regulator [Novisyntrophococcus fermenticellae]
MLYLSADPSKPVHYVSSGNLISEDTFIHDKRNLPTFVLISVLEGALYITQNNNPFIIKKNEFILLFPNIIHYGHKPSNGYLSYYWTHFELPDENYSIFNLGALKRNGGVFNIDTEYTLSSPSSKFLIPETGRLSIDQRTNLLFHQLLDMSKRDNYNITYKEHYALSVLLLELTAEAYPYKSLKNPSMPLQVIQIIEWIRTNYMNNDLSVQGIADYFNYHPTYLTSLFKEYTGYPLLTYLNRTRINVAKNILSTSYNKPICAIAKTCGFKDEKYFMKLFKKYEGMTPTTYRNAFAQKHLNRF